MILSIPLMVIGNDNNFWSNNPYNWNLNNPDYLYPWSFTDLTNRENPIQTKLRLKTNRY